MTVEAAPSKQIRPKVRSKTATTKQLADNNNNTNQTVTARFHQDDNGAQVEETRQRMESWMGLADASPSNKDNISSPKSRGVTLKDDRETSPSSSNSAPSNHNQQAPQDQGSSVADPSKAAKSILRTPKYTKQPPINETDASKVSPEDVPMDDSNDTSEGPQNAICKNLVVERDPTQPMRKRKVKPRPLPSEQSHSAVEGYVPSMVASVPPPASTSADAASTVRQQEREATSKKPRSDALADTGDTSPLILHSLEELFEAAGEELPLQHDPHKITDDTQLLEADIAFSVMTQDQYASKLSELKEQHEEEREAQLKVFLGTDKIFEGNDSNQDGDSSDEDVDGDDDLLEMFMGGDEENADDYFDDDGNPDDQEVEREPRAFRLLWETLSEWITPEAIQYIAHITASATKNSPDQPTWNAPHIQRSDVEASRCAGLMAMVKLYLPKSLEELGYPLELRRTADVRLGEFLRTFCYVQEAPKLPVKLWKAMTCILLEIVLVEERGTKEEVDLRKMTLPPSIATVEMTVEEYRYLTRSVVKIFELPA